MSASKLIRDVKPFPQTYDDWNELETQEKINYFLHGRKRAGRSFQSITDSFTAVMHTCRQIPILLEAQDKWILKDKAKRVLEKKEKSDQHDLMDLDQYQSDDDSDGYDPMYDQLSLNPYKKNNFKQTH